MEEQENDVMESAEFEVEDADLVNNDKLFMCYGSSLSNLLNMKFPTVCQCKEPVNLVDFKYVGTALQLKWVSIFSVIIECFLNSRS